MKSVRTILSIVSVLVVLAVSAFAAEPEAADITCSQGEDCNRILLLKADGIPMNLTGYQFKAQLRNSATDVTPLADLAIDTSTVAQGQITLVLPASLTAQLAGRSAVWDLRQTDPAGNVSYPVRGKFKCYWSVTR